VAENQRLFEENMRLKDVVLELEYRLRENTQRTTDLSALRNALEKKFGPVELPQINPIPISIYCNGGGNANSSVTTSGDKDSKTATSKPKGEESGTSEKKDTAENKDSTEKKDTKENEKEQSTSAEGDDSKKPEEDQEEEDEEKPKIPDVRPDPLIKNTKTIDLNRQIEIPSSMWDQGLVCGITRLSLQHCQLSAIPEQVFTLRCTLKELELGQNKLKQVPVDIGRLKKLTKLTLNHNQISSLPKEIGKLANLEDLNLSHNQFAELPEPVLQLKGLCSLILANNQISKLEGMKLVPLKALTLLSIENNNLSKLSVELGLIPNLKTIMVSGNSFRIPNTTIISKGSAEVLEYLRNKCPQQ